MAVYQAYYNNNWSDITVEAKKRMEDEGITCRTLYTEDEVKAFAKQEVKKVKEEVEALPLGEFCKFGYGGALTLFNAVKKIFPQDDTPICEANIDLLALSRLRFDGSHSETNPEWLWYDRWEEKITTGRWNKTPDQSLYVRADLIQSYIDEKTK